MDTYKKFKRDAEPDTFYFYTMHGTKNGAYITHKGTNLSVELEIHGVMLVVPTAALGRYRLKQSRLRGLGTKHLSTLCFSFKSGGVPFYNKLFPDGFKPTWCRLEVKVIIRQKNYRTVTEQKYSPEEPIV